MNPVAIGPSHRGSVVKERFLERAVGGRQVSRHTRRRTRCPDPVQGLEAIKKSNQTELSKEKQRKHDTLGVERVECPCEQGKVPLARASPLQVCAVLLASDPETFRADATEQKKTEKENEQEKVEM